MIAAYGERWSRAVAVILGLVRRRPSVNKSVNPRAEPPTTSTTHDAFHHINDGYISAHGRFVYAHIKKLISDGF
jgi:hypothetical protein|tara:strand:+ start:5825 stop:6046 length:222 start_codon:yes stop_codon:yes gene_type:complete